MNKILLFLLAFICSFFCHAQAVEHSIKKIVIDPGHGGKDPGTHYGNILEKDIVLDVALAFGKRIQQAYPNIEVIYTRSNDQFVSLAYRAFKAAEQEADLFISIHVNSCPTPSVRGVETFVLGLHRSQDNFDVAKKENSVILLEEDHSTVYQDFDPNSAESYIMFEMMQNENLSQSLFLAEKIQSSVTKTTLRADRGVKQAGFLVLRETSMPGVLVELGFLGNKTDRQFMNSTKGTKLYSKSLFEAFDEYLKHSEEFVGGTSSAQIDTPIYAIQIVSSRKYMSSFSLPSHDEVYYSNNENLYRYYVSVSDQIEVVREKLKAVQSHYPDAFIVDDSSVDFTLLQIVAK